MGGSSSTNVIFAYFAEARPPEVPYGPLNLSDAEVPFSPLRRAFSEQQIQHVFIVVSIGHG